MDNGKYDAGCRGCTEPLEAVDGYYMSLYNCRGFVANGLFCDLLANGTCPRNPAQKGDLVGSFANNLHKA
jgi:hypothetical protein